jgi:homoserine dehydrogenase
MPVNVGVLGCGVVGSAVVRAFSQLPQGMRPVVRSVAVRDEDRRRDCTLNSDVITTDVWAVVEDPSVDVIVEALGGVDPAAGLITRAMDLGSRS